MGRKIYKNTKTSPAYSQSLLVFINKTPVVKNHPTIRKNRELLQPRSTLMGITVYFYTSSSLIYTLEIHIQSFKDSVSLNIFILHRLRNKFLQLILISLDSASWELHQYSRRKCGPMENPKVETRSRDSNSGPHDCEADVLPHDHGHHQILTIKTLWKIITCLLCYDI